MKNNKPPAPYGTGFNGHAKSCDCGVCATSRVEEKVKLWKQHGAAAPLDDEKTVFVRSFWRSQPNHFNKLPHTRHLLVMRIRALTRATRR